MQPTSLSPSPKLRQSASYTPSSFTKGFIPSVLLNKNAHSPDFNRPESPIHNPKFMRSSSTFTTPEAKNNLAHISLYQNLIPPNLISMTRTESKRSNTLMIFRNKFESLKEINIDPGAQMTKKKFTGEQIRTADSLKAIICLVDRKTQEYDKKAREKNRGSMFINDLWASDFESNVVRFTNIKKELKKENSQLHKPLNEKFNDIDTIYEKKNFHKRAEEDISKLRTHKAFETETSQNPNDKSIEDRLENNSPVFLPRFLVRDESPTEKVINRFSSYILGGSIPATSPTIIKRKSTINDRGTSLDGFRLSESPVARKRPTLLVNIDRKGSTLEGFSPMNSQDEPVSIGKTVIAGSQTSLGKVLGSPVTPQTSFTLNKIRWNQIKRASSITKLEKQESRMSRMLRNKSISGLEGGEVVRRARSKVSFSLKVETLEKSGRMKEEEEVKNVIEDLIGRCDKELKENTEKCVEQLERLRQNRVKSQEERRKEKLVVKRKKEYIREFRNAIGYKEEGGRLGRLNANWKAEN